MAENRGFFVEWKHGTGYQALDGPLQASERDAFLFVFRHWKLFPGRAGTMLMITRRCEGDYLIWDFTTDQSEDNCSYRMFKIPFVEQIGR